ncbi:MAG: chemotaxis protein CheW [Candidatus Alkaliphilus sp. MAG34]
MFDDCSREPMLDMYIFETSELIEQLERHILFCEEINNYTGDAINEIFRIMHTIKGSSAMMLFNNIASLAHSVEDLFSFLREKKPNIVDYCSLSDLLLQTVDFIKTEIKKIKEGHDVDGEIDGLITLISENLEKLKNENGMSGSVSEGGTDSEEQQQYYIGKQKQEICHNKSAYKATVFFEKECQMENIRAYIMVHNLREIVGELHYIPEDIIYNDDSVNQIREEGFRIFFKTDRSYEEIYKLFVETLFLDGIDLKKLDEYEEAEIFSQEKEIILSEDNPVVVPEINEETAEKAGDKYPSYTAAPQSMISVSVSKLDDLTDLVGEMVISEAMVTQNPDLKGLELENFNRAALQFRKITNELHDMVMSIRMVPLSTTFHRMRRVVRDMCRKLGKEVHLEIIGEETEVDKNIIEHITDPLMHLVRNAIDHGIESTEDRLGKGKPREGTIILEAKNAGNEVHIVIKDDGKGLNRDELLNKAKANNLLFKPEEEMTDKEIFSLIFLPGFSTSDGITEFSGRGVGMDVVTQNIEMIGGTISVDSTENEGTEITLKIPLTLAIVDGMNIRVGNSIYTLPTNSIIESFRPEQFDTIIDPDGSEMIMFRGECYQIVRIHKLYNVETEITQFHEGIMIMVENNGNMLCIFADELLGQQQVVVKSLPGYIQKIKKISGIAGCTLLGDGTISLIIDVAGLIDR